ncbi:MAG: aminotransferase class V-fold PLP-dependent enzyme [Oscillospiraceae bacterium]|nr:aminotransferase class V-fold PLP-dependent enzyme [Oscillospiraceae bacterium]
MIYLDNGATSFHKPAGVRQAVTDAMLCCANPGRGGYPAAMAAAQTVYHCRETAADFFDCQPEQVVFTSNCTHGLNIAIRTLVKPGGRVAVSGFEHNAVTRPLHALKARLTVAGRKLFDWENTLSEFEDALRAGADAAVFTHVSNVFGYILPVEEMAALCRQYRVPFIIDAAQSAGTLPVTLKSWGADFIAMPGHKGLLGPQGTGLLLCGRDPEPLLAGGTGSESRRQEMPDFLPDRAEPGTLNVPGIAGLDAGMGYLRRTGIRRIHEREHRAAMRCAKDLANLGFQVFSGPNQAGTVSFVPETDCEAAAEILSKRGIAVRAGLHCAPLAHESAGTLETGTVRVSFGIDACPEQNAALRQAACSVAGQTR